MDCRTYLADLNKLYYNFESLNSQYLSMVATSQTLPEDFAVKFDGFVKQSIYEVLALQWKVVECIEQWKRAQQKAIITGMLDFSMLVYYQQFNSLSLKFSMLSLESINKCLGHPSIHQSMNFKMSLMQHLNETSKLVRVLLQHAFIVIDQPCSSILKYDPLTIISNAKFETKLCLLLDYTLLLKDSIKSLSLDLRLLKEEEICMVMSHGLEAILERKPSFNIINKAEPVFAVENQMLTFTIVCMLKVDINRRGHNPKALPVAEEKFKFVFWTKVPILNQEFVLHTFSLPVNVLSRKDYRNSYATILWDNAFPIENRQMFETRDSVHWSELATVLNSKFYKDVGAYLCAEHLEFIYTMVPNRREDNIVTWEQFSKTTLPMRRFTFFEWFYKNLVLVREQLARMYCDGLIHGFISSETSERLLLNSVDGTFLIRFSETFCGAISIAYVKNRKFDKLFPWDLDRLKKISLSHTIKCSDLLLYLYPNVPKDDVFCKYYIHNEVARSITGKDYTCDANIAQVTSTSPLD